MPEWHHNPRLKQRNRMRAMLRREGSTCRYCSRTMTTEMGRLHPSAPTRDHYVPRGRGGMDTLQNIVLACLECNGMKGHLLPDEFTAWLEGRASRLDKGEGWRTYDPVRHRDSRSPGANAFTLYSETTAPWVGRTADRVIYSTDGSHKSDSKGRRE